MGTTAIGFIDKVCVQSCIVLQCVPLPSNPALSTNERPVPNISLSRRNSDAYHRMNHELFRPSIWSRNIWVKWKPPSKSNCLHKSRRSISCNDFLPFGSKYCHARLQVPHPQLLHQRIKNVSGNYPLWSCMWQVTWQPSSVSL